MSEALLTLAVCLTLAAYGIVVKICTPWSVLPVLGCQSSSVVSRAICQQQVFRRYMEKRIHMRIHVRMEHFC
jgi:hypothetical protein